MAESDRPLRPGSEEEHDAVRSSNDRDQALEREGRRSPHGEGYDAAVKGTRGRTTATDRGRDVDPDSASSENDRDDTIDEK